MPREEWHFTFAPPIFIKMFFKVDLFREESFSKTIFKKFAASLISFISPFRIPLDGDFIAAINDNLPFFSVSAIKALICEVPMSKEVIYMVFFFFHFYSITFFLMSIAEKMKKSVD